MIYIIYKGRSNKQIKGVIQLKRTGSKRAPKQNFWNDQEMFPLLLQYKGFWKRHNNKEADLLVPEQVRDAVWNKLHPELMKIAYAAATKINPILNNKDVIESCMLHLHHTVVFNWSEERKKSYSYFYTCARAFLIEYLRGTGRGRIGGQLGKKHQVRKEFLIPKELKTEKEIMDYIHKDENYTWNYGKISRKKNGIPKGKKLFIAYRYDRELVEWEEEHEQIEQQDDWSWGKLADEIDWVILSEYIPDTNASVYTKKIAYVMLDVLRMIVENEVGKNVRVLLCYQMVRARFNHSITNHQMWLARDCIRQAFKYYAEDELY